MLPVTAPDAFSLVEGAVFHDQYEVVRRIDSGAMGAVYEVVDRRTKRRRALKVMLARFVDNPEVTARFRREATITAEVVSEHIVETFDAGVDHETGLPFLVMELLRGEDLGKLVARGALLAEDVVTLLMHAASALDKTHASGVVHRDLKPENMFVTRRDDGSPHLKILDFGIAKVIEKSATSATSTRNMGTPVYMSPEQVTGDGTVGPPADLYALGHLAYTMLVGEPYWLEDALAFETVYPLLLRIMQGATEPASVRAARVKHKTLPPAFDAWFAQATSHSPDARFKSAVESVATLARALGVTRPPLPSSSIDLVSASAPTVSPPRQPDPGASGDPLLPLPAPPPLPKHEDPIRTLSPVSSRPDTRPPSKRGEKPSRRRGLLVALGAVFFSAGVLLVILLARNAPAGGPSTSAAAPGPPSGAAASPPALARTPDPAPANTAAPETAEPPAIDPAAVVSPVLAAAAAQTAPASARPTSPTKKPIAAKTAPASSSQGSKSPPKTYGDPSRDL
jgi:serine/threonine protein kinase